MPSEVEYFKLILNGGSFALLVFLVLWTMLKGIPMLREDNRTTAKIHSDTISALVTEFRTERREQREFDRQEWVKRDNVIDRLAEAVNHLAVQVQGCPHHEPTPDSLRQRHRPDYKG